MKRIAVTGATGFVGRNLVQTLTLAGYEVHCFSRRPSSTTTTWDIASGPLASPPVVDAVVHCAAHVDDWATYADSHATNVRGTAHILETFPDVDRFIYISSASVYDPFCPSPTFTENSPCGNFLNAYSETKREAELLVMDSSSRSRIVLRPHIVYGPGDSTILPRILKARRFGRFLIAGDGTNVISLTHVATLVEAIMASIETPIAHPATIFNIADDRQDSVDTVIHALRASLSISEPIFHIPRESAYALGALCEYAARLTHRSHAPLLTRYTIAQMAYGHALDISRAKQQLGFAPLHNYTNSFKDLAIEAVY